MTNVIPRGWICEANGGVPCRQLGLGEEVKGLYVYDSQNQCVANSPCAMGRGSNPQVDGEEEDYYLQDLINQFRNQPFSFVGKDIDQSTTNAVLDEVFQNPLIGKIWQKNGSILTLLRDPQARQWLFGRVGDGHTKWVPLQHSYSPTLTTSPRMNAFLYIFKNSQEFPELDDLIVQILRQSPIDGLRWTFALSDKPTHSAILPFLSDPGMFHAAMMKLIGNPDFAHSRFIVDLLRSVPVETIDFAFRNHDYEQEWEQSVSTAEFPDIPYNMSADEKSRSRERTEAAQRGAAKWLHEFQSVFNK